jgi:hypothetical protein
VEHVCKYPLLEAVGEAGVVAPGDPLAVRQPPRPLRLEVEQALLQRVLVVVGFPLSGHRRGRQGGENEQQDDPRQGGAHAAAHCTPTTQPARLAAPPPPPLSLLMCAAMAWFAACCCSSARLLCDGFGCVRWMVSLAV